MHRRRVLAALGFGAAWQAARGQAPAPARTPPAAPAPRPAPRVGEMQALGDERFRIGGILIDKRGRSFSVPGRVKVLGKPLEYLATTPEGRKAYESLLALDTSGSELNLACILIGLERDPKASPSWPLTQPGQPVMLSVAWVDTDGRRRQLSAAQALLNSEAAVVEWAYTGSFTNIEGNLLAADVTGSLISFVKKDRTGIFEAVSGIGAGSYGSIRGNVALPPEGSPLELVVEAAAPSK